MGWENKAVFTCAIASGASTSSYIDLGLASFKNLTVNMVTAATNALLTVYGSVDGTTFYPVHERVNTAPVSFQALTIATSTSLAWATIACPPFRYIEFAASATIAGGTTITVIGDQ